MKWFNNLFSKTTTTEENIEIKIEDEIKGLKALKELDETITYMNGLLMMYRAFYYLSPEEIKKEVIKKMPEGVTELIERDFKDRDMTSWDKK